VPGFEQTLGDTPPGLSIGKSNGFSTDHRATPVLGSARTPHTAALDAPPPPRRASG